MRAREFMEADNKNSAASFNLLNTLTSLRNETDQIRLDSLIDMVRRQPGSEFFNFDMLQNAIKDDERVKEIVSGVSTDDTGVKHLTFVPLTTIDSPDTDMNTDSGIDQPSSPMNPKKTVKMMAKRASAK